MRLRHLIPVFVIAGVVLGGGVTAHAASDRQKSFSDGATQLRALWTRDEVAGLPASSVAPLRSRLDAQQPTAPWWSPGWIGDDGQLLLAQLGEQTRSAWNKALTAQRTLAEGAIAQWNDFASQEAKWLSADVISSAAQWAANLSASATPAAISALTATWQTYLTEQQNVVLAAQQQAAVVVAQQAQLASELQSAGGPQAVLTTAHQLVSAAASANLDAGNVAALASQLTAQIAANSAAALPTGEQLLSAVSTLRALIALNNQVEAQVRPLLYGVDQAEAERTPNAATLGAQQAAIAAQFRTARTAGQLSAVAATVTGLQGQITAELAANQCGHAVGNGKVITISLSLQEMLFYQDGCVAKATPVTTGRPQLRTPTGTFRVFYKTSPFTFISPWPPSSPFYYFPSPVSWVMEFAAGGYFIHDAPWEGSGSYGPGGEDNLSAASHGCVHTPSSTMQWAYSWTPVGTPVVISA